MKGILSALLAGSSYSGVSDLGVEFEDGIYGRRAIITSSWSDDMTQHLKANGVADIELNTGKGWQGDDFPFLAEFPSLKALTVIDWGISTIEPIHGLSELQYLKLYTYCNDEIRFSAFPQLENCAVEWRPKTRSLFSCTKLRDLVIIHYPGVDTDQFEALPSLETLQLLSSPIRNLAGLGALTKLISLRLASLRQLTSLAGIENLANLKRLQLQTCRKISSIDEIGALAQLEFFSMDNCGDISSIKVLDRLTNLRLIVYRVNQCNGR